MTPRALVAIALFPLSTVACEPAARVPAARETTPWFSTPANGTSALPSPAELRVRVRGPERVRYDATALGPALHAVRIQIANPGPSPARVRPLRVRFEAERDGVRFPCGESDATGDRLPDVLSPGAELTVEREIACAMPLPGAYTIRVRTQIGSQRAAEIVTELAIHVDANPGAPRPYPGRDALFVLLTGAPETAPLTPEAWAHGDYRATLTFINAGQKPTRLGAATLALDVWKRGSDVPCSGQAEQVALPAELASGATYVARPSVTCAPASEGDYAIVGRLSLAGASDAASIGGFALRVARDPLRFTPIPAPMIDPEPGRGDVH